MRSLVSAGDPGAEMAMIDNAPPPVLDTLTKRRERLLKQVADLDDAIAALRENPKINETLDLLRRVGV